MDGLLFLALMRDKGLPQLFCIGLNIQGELSEYCVPDIVGPVFNPSGSCSAVQLTERSRIPENEVMMLVIRFQYGMHEPIRALDNPLIGDKAFVSPRVIVHLSTQAALLVWGRGTRLLRVRIRVVLGHLMIALALVSVSRGRGLEELCRRSGALSTIEIEGLRLDRSTLDRYRHADGSLRLGGRSPPPSQVKVFIT